LEIPEPDDKHDSPETVDLQIVGERQGIGKPGRAASLSLWWKSNGPATTSNAAISV
jgi:hypothetical protein